MWVAFQLLIEHFSSNPINVMILKYRLPLRRYQLKILNIKYKII